MKYGERLVDVSVPEWSLNNIDYNALKHMIKAHTTRGQAKAITIPGQPDTALNKFESQLSQALRQEHDRVSLFLRTKSDELLRRLQHLSNRIHRLIVSSTRATRLSTGRQQVYAKYERELLDIGDEIASLPRFVKAQQEAFRKIIKKYKKWTGSSTLGDRFRSEVLDDPKSFTKQDFSRLQTVYEDLLSDLYSATPRPSASQTPVRNSRPTTSRRTSIQFQEPPPRAHPQPTHGYWNEYEHGSEAGDDDGGYVIYLSPDEDDGFLHPIFTNPIKTIKSWFGRKPPVPSEEDLRVDIERTPLLNPETSSLSYAATLAASQTPSLDSDDEGAASSEDFPSGYTTHYAAIPSINEQRLTRFRNKVLFHATWACFAAATVLLLITTTLIATGRHKMMAEVDAGVVIGVVTALFSTCAGLAMLLLRTDKVGWIETGFVWLIFAGLCAASGALLVLVVGGMS